MCMCLYLELQGIVCVCMCVIISNGNNYTHDFNSTPITGADVLCDGCGVVYHGHCVDLEDSEPPPCWLCLTCEQLGLRASSQSDPHHHSRRRGKSR